VVLDIEVVLDNGHSYIPQHFPASNHAPIRIPLEQIREYSVLEGKAKQGKAKK